MRNAFFTLLLLVFTSIGANAFAQQAAEGPMKFEVYAANENLKSATPIVWYIEPGGLSDIGGISIAKFDGGYQDLLTRLESLRNDSRVSSFNLDEQGHKLVISMKGMTTKGLRTALEKHVATYQASTH